MVNEVNIFLRGASILAISPLRVVQIKKRRQGRAVVLIGAIVSLLTLTACGSGAGDKVDSKGSTANAAAGDESSAIAASSPTPTTSEAPTTGNTLQPGTTQTRNNDISRVSSVPKPQISTGGSDFFLFTQARGVLGVDTELKAANIIIDVEAGVLTLSGTVANVAQKSKAEKLVRAVGGVKEVKNRLRISS